jgi:hypothetical protein
MDEATKSEVKKIIDQMFTEPTVEVDLYRGMKQTNSRRSKDGEFEPTKGRTVIIKVHGGANNVEIRNVKTEDDEAVGSGR